MNEDATDKVHNDRVRMNLIPIQGRRWDASTQRRQDLLIQYRSKVVAVSIAQQTGVSIKGADSPHDESVRLASESGETILCKAKEMLEMVDPHAGASVARIHGHRNVVDE